MFPYDRDKFDSEEGLWGGIQRESDLAEEIMGIRIPTPMLGHPFRMSVSPGCYDLGHSISEDRLPTPRNMNIASDEVVVMRDECSKKLRKELKQFFGLREQFEESGMLHKRGVMLYGPPGSGKSTLLKEDVKYMVEEERKVVFVSRSPYILRESMRVFRKLEPGSDLVVIMEDVDEIAKSWGLHDLLEMIDGVDTIDHVFFIGTTNNLKEIPEKLKRAGRFDRKIEVPMPTKEMRFDYLRKKMKNLSEGQARRVSESTEGFGFGQLREVVVSVCGFKQPLVETVNRLRQDMKQEMLTEQKSKYVSFVG